MSQTMQFRNEIALSIYIFYSIHDVQYNFDRTDTKITMTCLSGNNNNGHTYYIYVKV